MYEFLSDSTLIGHIYGGIYSPQNDAFTANNTGVTNAHNVIYEVWLHESTPLAIKPINGANPFKAIVFPNPAKDIIKSTIEIPNNGDLSVYIMDINGKIVSNYNFEKLKKGKQTIELNVKNKLSGGQYTINFNFDGKYSAIEKIVILE